MVERNTNKQGTHNGTVGKHAPILKLGLSSGKRRLDYIKTGATQYS
jgi:hypothetical protein